MTSAKAAQCGVLKGPCQTPDTCLAANECHLTPTPSRPTLAQRLRDAAVDARDEGQSYPQYAIKAHYVALAALLDEAANALESEN